MATCLGEVPPNNDFPSLAPEAVRATEAPAVSREPGPPN